jgi:2-keto-4-pentenoate hydratase/2-oxohepta-3-ene-1,7-dioic acid hydratase in catechol pathway
MKLTFFDDYKLGVVKGDAIVDVSSAVSDVPHTSPHDLINSVIEEFDALKGPLSAAAEKGRGLPLDGVTLRAPLPKPFNIVAMAVNYMEDGTRDAPAPINAFHKSPDSVIGHGGTIVLPDVPATIFEFESEMALVISKRASKVRAEDAFDYVFGYMNFLDVSARGLPPGGFYLMKSRDTFAPMGPWIVTADEIEDPQQLQVRSWSNGTLKQNFNTSDMAHKIPRCIEWVTAIHALGPGDIIATGTNHRGLTAMMDGDTVELEIDGLGRLELGVQDELKRTWPRETRLERTDRGLEGPAAQATGKYAPD